MEIQALLDKQNKLVADARAIQENPSASEDQIKAADKMLEDAIATGKRIQNIKELDAQMKSFDQGEQPKASGSQKTYKNAADLYASEEYNEAYFKAMRSGNMAHILNVNSTTPNSSGGYTIPTEFERSLQKDLLEANVMRRICSVTTTSSPLEIPVLSDRGVATWTAENAAYTESDLTFDQLTLGAYKLARITKVSEELVQDSAFDMASELSMAFAESFGKAEEAAFLTGDGSGKPNGLLNQTTKGADATVSGITFDNLKDLMYSLTAPYRAKSRWLMNDSTALLLFKLKDSNGQYIWQPAVTADKQDTLIGKPVEYSEFMPAIGASAKSVLFGNFAKYRIGDRKGRTMQRLVERYADLGQVGFRMYQRVDGVFLDNKAIKHLENAAS